MTDAYPELAVDPSDQERARDWTLSAADLDEVRRGGGDDTDIDSPCSSALSACSAGSSMTSPPPVRIANHIGRKISRRRVRFIEATVRTSSTRGAVRDPAVERGERSLADDRDVLTRRSARRGVHAAPFFDTGADGVDRAEGALV